jgi:hypothetical protein
MMDAALVQPASVGDEALRILSQLGVPQSAFAPEGVTASSPITGELITKVRITSPEEVSTVIARAKHLTLGAQSPRRGEGSSYGFSRRNCALPRMISAGS